MESSIESILKQLECIMRGKKIDENVLYHQSITLLEWSYSEYLSKGNNIIDKDINQKEDIQQKYIDISVLLHNKSKSVININNSKLFNEILTNLKASSAWILTTYGYNSTKFVLMFIRLHCRVANEMILLDKILYAEKSLKKASECWEMLNSQALERILSSVELEGLRFIMFNSFLDYSKILRNTNGNEDELKKCIASALELTGYLPTMRLIFIRHILEMGQELAIHKSSYHDAIHYLRISLTSLHLLHNNSNYLMKDNNSNDSNQSIENIESEFNQQEFENNIHILLVKTYLSMAYAYQELNEFEKALSCIIDAEPLGKNLISPETFTFSKFSILCKSNNELEASKILSKLIEETNSFDMALNSILLFLKGIDFGKNKSSYQYLEYFTILGKKFQIDPEFSTIRLLDLQYSFMILQTSNYNQNDEYLQRVKNICHDIIRDHQQHIRTLSNELSKKFLNMLQEQVKLYRSQKLWKEAIYWCDVMLSFIDTNDSTTWVTIMMWKSDSCLNIQDRCDEALTLAMTCVKIVKSTQTILVVFNTSLHVNSNQQSIDIFLSLLKTLENNGYASTPDYLRKLILGCQVVQESKASNLKLICSDNNYGTNSNYLIISLLDEWMKSYLHCRTEGSLLQFVQDSEQFQYQHYHENMQDQYQEQEQEQQTQEQTQEQKLEQEQQQQKNILLKDYLDEKENGLIKFSFCEIFLEIIRIFLNTNLQENNTEINQNEIKISSNNNNITTIFGQESNKYFLQCSTLFLRNIIYEKYKLLQNVLSSSSKENCQYNPPLYESTENIMKLGEIAWNIGIILNHESNNNNNIEKMILGIEFLEIANNLFLYLKSINKHDSSLELFCIKCLLSSTSLRMDISTILNDLEDLKQNKNENNDNEIKNMKIDNQKLIEENNNLEHIKQNILSLSELIKSIINIPDEIRRLYLILSIAYYCRINSSELEGFVDMNQKYFLMFPPDELERCADITQNEKFGNLIICRKMLLFGIQVITREKISNYYLLSNFYRRLIYLSPSRLQALEWIEDFEQFLKSISKDEIISFSNDSIDSICIMCYNWGITLVELNQYELAEKFAGKSLSLTKYVSTKVLNLKEIIQDAYLHILKTKVEHRGENISTNLSFFGIQPSSTTSSSSSSAINSNSNITTTISKNNTSLQSNKSIVPVETVNLNEKDIHINITSDLLS